IIQHLQDTTPTQGNSSCMKQEEEGDFNDEDTALGYELGPYYQTSVKSPSVFESKQLEESHVEIEAAGMVHNAGTGRPGAGYSRVEDDDNEMTRSLVSDSDGENREDEETGEIDALAGGNKEVSLESHFEIDHESERRRLMGRPLVYTCAVCSSLTSVLLGYDVGVMSGAKEYMQPELGLSEVQTEVVVGVLNLVAAVGGLVAGKAADSIGRKRTIGLACAIFIAGATLMTSSQGFLTMLTGRIVTGIGVGCAMVIGPTYVTELSPPAIRGMLVTLTDISINLGILLGYISSLMCDELITRSVPPNAKWRVMVAIGIIPPTLILLCLTVMPDSPRWLISQGRFREGYVVLYRLHDDEKEAQESLREVVRSAEQSEHESSWGAVIWPTDPLIKTAMAIGLGLAFWQQASGSEAAVYYSPEVLEDNGWSGRKLFYGNLGVGGCKLLGEVFAFFLLDKIGRTPLFLASSISMTVCLLAVAISFSLELSGYTTLVWLSLFMLCFSLGLGPITFVVAAEIFPLAVRGKAMAMCIFVNRFMSGLISLSYESVADSLTPAGSFYMFAAVSAASVWFYATKVPETKGKTLE
ncbi:unnamed protein product, partial [Chrysoparadoxa australica]